jgi:lysophospholipase L1-like esterase
MGADQPRVARRGIGLLAITGVLLLGAVGGEALATPSGPLGPAPEAVTVVGLGDSVTGAAHCGCAGFIQDYADLLAHTTRATVHGVNLGANGQTSDGLLAAVQPGQPDVDSISTASIVVVTIGANDFVDEQPAIQSGHCGGRDGLGCTTATLATVSRNVTAVIGRVRTLRSGAAITIKVTGYWNVFEDGAVARQDYSAAFRGDSDALTRRLNDTLRAVCATTRAQYVDLYGPFKTDGDGDDTALLAADGDHPNAAGHRVIARALAGAS